MRKFSRNVEFSQFLNEWRVGGTVDSNIIFSERSYIPRAASVNLTTSLFGENVNLFEVGLRAEGFEKMHIVRRPLKEAFLASKIVILD